MVLTRTNHLHSKAAPPAHSRRAQASVEVMVYVGFFLLVFVVINLFFLLQVSQDIRQRQYGLAQASASQTAEYLQLALAAGPGFSSNFSIPPSINGQPYSINITNSSSIYVQIEQSSSMAGSSAAPPPLRIFFPLAIRSLDLGCRLPADPASVKFPPCPSGDVRLNYISVSGNPVKEIGINATKGWMKVNNTLGLDGLPELLVS